ncbi:MAG: MMPL family transporter [Desulfosarcinaceae bacterium]|nr:MMPL family transporter [Desulfosarcinaceae bacterium]
MSPKFTIQGVHLPALIATIVVTVLLAWGGILRLTFDTDIVGSLPSTDPVIRDAVHLFKHHPMKDRITIDVGLTAPDPQRLVTIGLAVEAALGKSPLFASIGFDELQRGLPELVSHTTAHLPMLFSAADLEDEVGPRLLPEAITARLTQEFQQLAGMDAIGQYHLLAADPLGLREIVLARLGTLAPHQAVRMVQGRLISSDGRHTLTGAVPSGSATDTQLAARISGALASLELALKDRFDTPDNRLTLTVVGAHRAALDNETIVKADVRRALLLATIGIALLLLIAFPRPWVGLMALLPAAGGTAAALFTISLFNDTISLLVLGFGGAIISITVDHGICYLLFLDRSKPTTGKAASHEVWSVGLLAALTTVGAFATLGLSGVTIFTQLGYFTALGIGYAFLFVHTVFPTIFPQMPAASSRRPLILHRLANRLARGGVPGLILVLGLGALLTIFARPDFDTELSRLNTVSRQTLAAEAALQEIWGNLFDRTYLLLEAASLADLQSQSDRLLTAMEQQSNGFTGFTAAMVFPGRERLEANLAAWTDFWTPERRARVTRSLKTSAATLGFTPDAFAPFIGQLTPNGIPNPSAEMAPAIQRLLQISHDAETGTWRHFVALSPLENRGPSERPVVSAPREWAVTAIIFDPQGFASRLGELLFTTFAQMLAVIGGAVICLLLLFFADLKLTLIALLPLLFAMVATLGTLNLLGHHLDLPGLMLAIVVFGMGIDYTLFFIRSYQRYQHATAPPFTLVRTAILMASASTLIGFGVMGTAQHALLRSVGLTSLLGIGYCLLGAFLILPPLLDRHVARRPPEDALDTAARVRWRYRSLEGYPRLFARFKLHFDPLFTEIGPLLPDTGDVETILDIGSGYGVPANWLSETFPKAKLFGLEPQIDRVRVANLTLGDRGEIVQGGAPDIPQAPQPAQLVTLLDMTHYLSDRALELTLQRLYSALSTNGQVLVRSVIPSNQGRTLLFRFEDFKLRRQGFRAHYRTPEELVRLFSRGGFRVDAEAPSGIKGELAWFVLRPVPHFAGEEGR